MELQVYSGSGKLGIEVIVEPNGEGFITGYVKNNGEFMNIEAVDKFIEYIEDMILAVAK